MKRALIKPKSKRPSVTKLRNKMDKLWATIGKETAKCEVCQKTGGQVHPHHYIGRRNLRLRWDLSNRIWLCPTHHTFGMPCAHADSKWFEEWMIENRQEDWLYCNSVKNELLKSAQYQEVLEKLKGSI